MSTVLIRKQNLFCGTWMTGDWEPRWLLDVEKLMSGRGSRRIWRQRGRSVRSLSSTALSKSFWQRTENDTYTERDTDIDKHADMETDTQTHKHLDSDRQIWKHTQTNSTVFMKHTWQNFCCLQNFIRNSPFFAWNFHLSGLLKLASALRFLHDAVLSTGHICKELQTVTEI